MPWLPDDVHNKLNSELRFIVGKMKEDPQPLRRLYYLSGVFNEVARQLNWCWDDNLALVHFVTQAAHANLAARVSTPPNIGFPNVDLERMMERLTEVISELAICVEKNDDGVNLYAAISHLAGLAYAASNHGVYLADKKLLRLAKPTAP